ncbi:Ribokinase [Giardia duodenalis ATCC 50581]|nr:Ribokinase [Giardia intestinalis ATCC 50581]
MTTASAAKIVIIGSYNRDLVWYVKDFPVGGQTINGSFATSHGGKGSNQAIACGKVLRDPSKVFFVGAVGKDTFGDEILAHYKELGIPNCIKQVSGAPTGNAGIFVAESGENMIVISEGANGMLKPSLAPDLMAILVKATLVVMQCEISPENTLLFVDIIKQAKAQNSGLRFVFNPAPYRADYDFSKILSITDIFCPNELEALEISGTGKLEGTCDDSMMNTLVEKLSKLSPTLKFVLFTLGSRGSRVIQTKSYDSKAIGIYSHGRAIDTSGAGDCFIGSFCVRLMELAEESTGGSSALDSIDSIAEAARFASVAAGISVTRKGTSASVPQRQEVDEALSKFSGK